MSAAATPENSSVARGRIPVCFAMVHPAGLAAALVLMAGLYSMDAFTEATEHSNIAPNRSGVRTLPHLTLGRNALRMLSGRGAWQAPARTPCRGPDLARHYARRGAGPASNSASSRAKRAMVRAASVAGRCVVRASRVLWLSLIHI